MKIRELTIKNFRSFKGETSFDFNTNNEKNIILIGGENGAGKTSIFEAIKLCIYGPLSYKYQGLVPNYISRIKSIINEDIFTESAIQAFVQMKITLNINGVEDLYKIKRKWELSRGKLTEEFIIFKDEKKLNASEKEKFETFMRNTIPPNVFDLFFFDGEKLSDFFADKNMELKLKDTILTLNNFDVFSILSRELHLNTRRKDKERTNLRDQVIEAEKLEEAIYGFENELHSIISDIEYQRNLIDELNIEIENVNNEFIKSGGLDAKEKEDLLHNINVLDNRRGIINQEIKDYSNDMLPFLIVKDLLTGVKDQIYQEENYIIYNAINDKISNKKIADIISKTIHSEEVTSDDFDKISNDIKKEILPIEFDKDFLPIHNLSKEQQNKVISIIDRVILEDIDKVNYFEEIARSTKKIALYREKLTHSLRDEDQEKYIKTIYDLNYKLNEASIIENDKKSIEEKIEQQILLKSIELKKLNEKINILKRADNVKDISNTLVNVIEELLKVVTVKKKEEVEKYFNKIFSEIIRKEKFIDFIKLDDSFKISLYVKKKFTNDEIIRLIANLGIDEIEKKFGQLFVEEIYKKYMTTDRKKILIYLNKEIEGSQLELNTKVDVMNLSSGEKQVYILCLYWAIIKSSGINIPFVIDTPYGRIDEKHRRAITTKFFPKISDQVIVLSTNTEIEAGLYEDINKYVSKEYMLEYNIHERKTIVDERYFYEVI